MTTDETNLCTDTVRALWIEEIGRCRINSEEPTAATPDSVLVRTLFSGISRGTETLVFSGKVPAGEHERMRAPHQEGSFSFPVKYGYSAVGVIEAGSPDLIGQTVFCLHPHQDRFVVPLASVSPIPSSIPAARAVLAANMETALNIVWDAAILPGDRVAVFGAGVVGSLVAHIANGIPATDTVLVDINPRRAALALSLGISFSTPEAVEGEYDVLINASASPEALTLAIDLAGLEARVVEASWYGERVVPLVLGGAFHSRRLSIVSSQVGTIPANRQPRWTFPRRMAKAVALLEDARLDNLVSGESRFDDLETDYARILSDTDTLCHRIRY